MDDRPNIDADLAGATPTTHGEPSTPWKITDEAEATWAVRKRRNAEEAIAHQETIARAFYDRLDAERLEVDQWLAKVTADDRRTVDYMTAQLVDWLHRLVEVEPKLRTKHLPGASLKYRPGAPSVTVANVDDFAAWAIENAPDLVRKKYEVAKDEVKKAIAAGTWQVNEDGVLFDGMGNGEVLPGIRLETGDDKYTVELSTPLADSPEAAA